MAWTQAARDAAALTRKAHKKAKTSVVERLQPSVTKKSASATISLAGMRSLAAKPKSVRHGVGFGKTVALSNTLGQMEVKVVGKSVLPYGKSRPPKK